MAPVQSSQGEPSETFCETVDSQSLTETAKRPRKWQVSAACCGSLRKEDQLLLCCASSVLESPCSSNANRSISSNRRSLSNRCPTCLASSGEREAIHRLSSRSSSDTFMA